VIKTKRYKLSLGKFSRRAKTKKKPRGKVHNFSRVDPTQTQALRKAITMEMRKRFARLKGDLYDFIVKGNAFGLTENVFCPTGEGGGIDATCSPGDPGGGQYDHKSGTVKEPSKLYYKSMEPIKILESGVIKQSKTFGGVSLTSKKGIESHGPFEIEIENPSGLGLKPALYGDPIHEKGELSPTGYKDQFGNKYTPDEWESLPFGKPTADAKAFRQNEMFKDEHEWRSIGPVPVSSAKVNVYKEHAGWRIYPRKNVKIHKELVDRGIVTNIVGRSTRGTFKVNANPYHDDRGRFSSGDMPATTEYKEGNKPEHEAVRAAMKFYNQDQIYVHVAKEAEKIAKTVYRKVKRADSGEDPDDAAYDAAKAVIKAEIDRVNREWERGNTQNQTSSPKILEVPDIRQKDHYSCGACATMSVGRYFGVGPEKLEEWKDALGTTLEKSTHPSAIVAYLKSLGLHVEDRQNLTISDLKQYISQGMPVIVPVQDYGNRREPGADYSYGHYLTIIGVPDDNHIIAQDSSEENVLTKDNESIQEPGRVLIDGDTFNDVWHDKDDDGNKFIHYGIAVGRGTRGTFKVENYNPDEPRDEHGRWSSMGVGDSVSLNANPNHDEHGKFSSGDGSGGGIVRAVMDKIRSKVTEKYQKLANRYGSKYAKAIVVSALAGLPLPIPFSMAITAAPVITIAEVHRWLTTNEEIYDSGELTPQDIERLAKRLRWELRQELGKEHTNNSFCATGEGGGIDPSCSPHEVIQLQVAHGEILEVHANPSEKDLRIWLDRPERRDSDGDTKPGMALKGFIADGKAYFFDTYEGGSNVAEFYHSEVAKAITGRNLLAVSKRFECSILNGKVTVRSQVSVSKAKELRKWAEPRGIVVNVKDTYNENPNYDWTGQSTTTDNAGAYAFTSDPQKIEAFQRWLKTKMSSYLTSKTEEELWEKYTIAGFKKGAGRAFDSVKKSKLKKTHPEIFSPQHQASVSDFYKGTRQQFLESSFGQPVAVEKVKLLAGRAFDDLEGITSDMSTRMSRVLTDGLVQGKHPKEVGKDLADVVDITRGRAERIARTEIIRAHAEGSLLGYENMGVKELGVEVEWTATDDNVVCPDCADLDGTSFSIEEAHGMLPLHPDCRCAWSPSVPAGNRLTKNLLNYLTVEEKFERWAVVVNRNCDMIFNSFCPTGQGGGVDATCSPSHESIEDIKARRVETMGKLFGNPTPSEKAALEKQFKEDGDKLDKLAKVGEQPSKPTKATKTPTLTREKVEGKSREIADRSISGVVKFSELHKELGSPPVREVHKQFKKMWSEGKISPMGFEGRGGEGHDAYAEEGATLYTPDPSRPYEGRISGFTFNERVEGGFFARCARDEHGHCLPEGGEVVSHKELRAAQKQARAKFRNAPQPTKEEIANAHQKMNKIGADDYEMQIRGSSRDRAAARKKLLNEFSHDGGHTCPCIYCGIKLDDSTITRDKMYTAREGGRYRSTNTVPACLGCNKSRGDIPFRAIKWPRGEQ
jgi:SPP1 gp7 family putative phage head morphogenesis protein